MAKRNAASIEGDQQDIVRISEATSASGESSEGQGVFRQELDNGCDSPQNHTSQEQNNASQDDDGSEGSGKKQRLVWSRQLHAEFIEAVKILGHNAVPTKILRLMNEPEVTREQVASHLQKYRLQLKKLAGLPPDAPLDTQTKEIMQATQNIFAAATLPSTVLPGLMSTVPLQSGLAAMPQFVYSIPQGLTFVNGMSAAVQQPLHALSKSGLAAHQPVLTALGAGNMMALNMLPVAYNYNPYNVMVLPQGMYSGLGAGVPSGLDALQAEYDSREHGREDVQA